jgi:hypothetical protein
VTTLHDRARALLGAAWLAYQPVAAARVAAEIRHDLRAPLTPATARRLLDVLQALDMTRAESARSERDALARDVIAWITLQDAWADTVAEQGPIGDIWRAFDLLAAGPREHAERAAAAAAWEAAVAPLRAWRDACEEREREAIDGSEEGST